MQKVNAFRCSLFEKQKSEEASCPIGKSGLALLPQSLSSSLLLFFFFFISVTLSSFQSRCLHFSHAVFISVMLSSFQSHCLASVRRKSLLRSGKAPLESKIAQPLCGGKAKAHQNKLANNASVLSTKNLKQRLIKKEW
uniref:Uncharacterized protein n=1 Tax=Pediastrum duplex TaxID=3105 RepID=A0A2U8GII2_PEDDU|nr:hypothetical protein [Pediastrum duplex]